MCVDGHDAIALSEGRLVADRFDAILLHANRCCSCRDLIDALCASAADRSTAPPNRTTNLCPGMELANGAYRPRPRSLWPFSLPDSRGRGAAGVVDARRGRAGSVAIACMGSRELSPLAARRGRWRDSNGTSAAGDRCARRGTMLGGGERRLRGPATLRGAAPHRFDPRRSGMTGLLRGECDSGRVRALAQCDQALPNTVHCIVVHRPLSRHPFGGRRRSPLVPHDNGGGRDVLPR